MRAELSELLRQHRIQQRLGGAGIHTVPATKTASQRQQMGEQIRQYRQSALTWCHQATVAVTPVSASNLVKPPADPFRTVGIEHVSLAALRSSLEDTLRASTASLPTLEELTTPSEMPLVERWRHLAKAAALGEHDFDAGLGHGRLDAAQCQTVIADVAAIVRALVVLDQRYAQIPGWEKLARPDRLGWSALACALDASLDPPDYSVEILGWQPPVKVFRSATRPGLLGILQAEHNLAVRLQTFPCVLNLRRVVDSQRLLSDGLSRLAEPVDPTLHAKWRARGQTYAALQRELRNVGGRVGKGGLAAAEGASAVRRLEAAQRTPNPENPRVLSALERAFATVDLRVADIIEDGIARKVYLARVRPLELANGTTRAITLPRDRFIPSAAPELRRLVQALRTTGGHSPVTPRNPTAAAQSRAELAAALLSPPRRPNSEIEL